MFSIIVLKCTKSFAKLDELLVLCNVIIMSSVMPWGELWLSDDVSNSELFITGYDVKRIEMGWDTHDLSNHLYRP